MKDRSLARLPPWAYWTCLVFGVLGLLISGAPLALRMYMLRNLDPTERAHIHDLMTKPVQFPSEWDTELFTSPAVTSAALELAAEAERVTRLPRPLDDAPGYLRDDMIRGRRTFDRDLLTTLSLQDAVTSHLAEMTAAVATMPDWTSDPVGPMFNPGPYNFHIAGLAALDRSALLWIDGVTTDALSFALAALSLWRGSPVNHGYWDDRGVNAALSMLCTITGQTSDAQMLRHTADELTRLKPLIVYPVCAADFTAVLMIPELLMLRREGCTIDLKPGRPAIFYLRQCVRQMDWLSRKKRAELRAGDPLLDYYQPFPDYFGMELPWPVSTSPVVFKLSMSSFPEWLTRDVEWYARDRHELEVIKRERYDLAQVYVAARIRQLQSGTVLKNVADLVPEFFATEPMDCSTSASYMWSEPARCFYAAGPNGRDDHLSSHVSTNMQYGDITMPGPAVPPTGWGRL
jgi:hypothetical protein